MLKPNYSNTSTPTVVFDLWAPNEEAKLCPIGQAGCTEAQKTRPCKTPGNISECPFTGYAPLWYHKGGVQLNGETAMSGGTSITNPNRLQTFFNYHQDNKNYIRGDTEIRGKSYFHDDICMYDSSSNPPKNVCISLPKFKKLKQLAEAAP